MGSDCAKIYDSTSFELVKNKCEMVMQLIVMGSCRRVKWRTEVLDDRSTQGVFTTSLTVKALRESHTLNIVP